MGFYLFVRMRRGNVCKCMLCSIDDIVGIDGIYGIYGIKYTYMVCK
jgi:hypothetical protein